MAAHSATVLPGQLTLDDAFGDTMSRQHPATPQEEPVTEQQPEYGGQVAEQAADAVENNSPVEVAGNGDSNGDQGAEQQVEAPGANAGTDQAQ